MPKKLYNKLVRDRMPEIMRSQGEEPVVRVLTEDEFKQKIRLKLLADAGEARVAKTREELVKELADVLEIVDAIADVESVPLDEIQLVKTQRRTERGGFERRVYLVSSEITEK